MLHQPLSDYLRYEFVVYEHTVRAGEDVRIVDDDVDGHQVGRELLERVDPTPYVAVKQQVSGLAVPFLEYQAKLVG